MPPPLARVDDTVTGRALRFDDARAVLCASTPAQVGAVLAAAQAAADDGAWVVGFVGHEGARAFAWDDGSRHAAATPAAWFAVTDAPTEVELLPPPTSAPALRWEGEWSRADHRERVEAIRAAIGAGEVYQVNLTSRLRARFDGDALALHAALLHAQAGARGVYLDTGRFAVACASPELFVEVENGLATMRPMKGTAARSTDAGADARAAASLAASAKDRAENVMIVDLVRNDLSLVAEPGSVVADAVCAVETYPTVHQLTSRVRARLADVVDLVDVLRATAPPGSVTGAPKRRAMQVIDALETSARGVYCGMVGYLAPRRRAFFDVAIRTAVVDRGQGSVEYGAGGGITWDSDAGAEWRELLLKTAVLPRAPVTLLETMRVDADGRVHRLSGHLARLTASADRLGLACDPDAVRAALTGLRGPARVRVLLGAGGAVDVETSALPAAATGPVRLAVDDDLVDPDDPRWRHKTTDREPYDRRRARRPDVDDVVMVNVRGEVTETTTATIAVELDGRWVTPPGRRRVPARRRTGGTARGRRVAGSNGDGGRPRPGRRGGGRQRSARLAGGRRRHCRGAHSRSGGDAGALHG